MALVCLKRLRWVVFAVSAPLAWCQSLSPAPQPVAPKSDQRVVISVGDEKITAGDLDRIIQALPEQYRGYYAGAGKRMLPQLIVEMKVLSAEAVKQKLPDQPMIHEQIEVARESILADAVRKQIEQDIAVSDQQLQDYYQQHKSEFEEVRIRQIRIYTRNSPLGESSSGTRRPMSEADARKKLEDIRQKILAGADFAQMARENSEDTATAASGGDLGFIVRGKVVPPVADAAYSLAPGQVSEIISTPYGLDLIKVEGKRFRPLDDLRKPLLMHLRQRRFQEVIQRLESPYNVFVDDQFFGTKPAASAPLPAN